MSDYERWQEQQLAQALATRRVVMLTGPRQCGKTTLARKLVDNAFYRTLDDLSFYRAALEDPHLFVSSGPENKTLIIDEIQKAPELLPAIKKIVDQNNRPGQFLITGSANILTLPTVKESMAGRIGKIRLRPLSHGEVVSAKPTFIENAFSQKFNPGKNNYKRNDLIEIIFKGGFPEAMRLDGQPRRNWHRDYIDALIEHDLHDISKLRQTDILKDLVTILAAWSSKYMDTTAIGSGFAIDQRTLASYISLLKSFYIIETIPQWRKTDYDRIGKKDKIIMTDSGMMTALLGWKADIANDGDKIGKLFETFAYNELAAQVDAALDICQIYQYRDHEKREIDFIIEHQDNKLLAIEVKSAMTIKKSDFTHIKWFKSHLAKERPVIGVVLYTGDDVIPFGENLWAVPFCCLWG